MIFDEPFERNDSFIKTADSKAETTEKEIYGLGIKYSRL